MQDFFDLHLRKNDTGSLWMQAIRSWQDLGKIYADKGKKAEAIMAYQESVRILDRFRSRRGRSGEYLRYADTSSRALAKLGARVPPPSVQAEE